MGLTESKLQFFLSIDGLKTYKKKTSNYRFQSSVDMSNLEIMFYTPIFLQLDFIVIELILACQKGLKCCSISKTF